MAGTVFDPSLATCTWSKFGPGCERQVDPEKPLSEMGGNLAGARLVLKTRVSCKFENGPGNLKVCVYHLRIDLIFKECFLMNVLKFHIQIDYNYCILAPICSVCKGWWLTMQEEAYVCQLNSIEW